MIAWRGIFFCSRPGLVTGGKPVPLGPDGKPVGSDARDKGWCQHFALSEIFHANDEFATEGILIRMFRDS